MNQDLDFTQVPSVNFSRNSLEFQAKTLDENLTQTLTINHSVPKPILQGKWSVIPHLSDPIIADGEHPWIVIKPKKFQKNKVVCSVTVQTNQLKANQVYERQLILNTNSNPQNYTIPLTVKTALIPTILGKKFYILLGITFLILMVALIPAYTYFELAMTWQTPQFIRHPDSYRILVDLLWKGFSLLTAIIWLYQGSKIGLSRGGLWVIPSVLLSCFMLISMIQLIGRLSAMTSPAFINPDPAFLLLFRYSLEFFRFSGRVLMYILGGGSFFGVGVVWGWLTKRYQKAGFEQKESKILAFLIILSSFSWGVVFFSKWLSPLIILTGILSVAGIAKLIPTSVKKRQKVIQAYLKSETQRIPESAI